MISFKLKRDYGFPRKTGKDDVLVLAAFILLAQLSCVTCLTPTEKEQINNGLELGKGIADLLKNKEFTTSLTKIAKSAGPYLAVAATFVDIVLAFIPTESAELKAIKELMTEIDNRFDQMDSRFNDLERKIDWTAVSVNFGQIEQNILAMSKEYEYLYKVPQSAAANQKTIFVERYENDYQNSGYKLYDAIMSNQGLFQENLGASVMRQTRYDRKHTQIFLRGMMQLLIQAAKIELVYLQAENYTENAEFMRDEWEIRIKRVTENFKHIDRDVKTKFDEQFTPDAIKFAAENTGLSNREFSENLYKILSEKYYWRDWIVFVYNPIKGYKKHALSVGSLRVGCVGDLILRQNGRNIWIQSSEKGRSKIDERRAENYLKRVKEYKKVVWFKRSRKAVDVFKEINPDPYRACGVAVIKRKSGLAIEGDRSRLAFVSRKYFNLAMWG